MKLTDTEIQEIARRQRVFSLMGFMITAIDPDLDLIANVGEDGAHIEPAVRGGIESAGIFRRADMLAMAMVKNRQTYEMLYDIASIYYWTVETEKITG
jgi:hypothetical protein